MGKGRNWEGQGRMKKGGEESVGKSTKTVGGGTVNYGCHVSG